MLVTKSCADPGNFSGEGVHAQRPEIYNVFYLFFLSSTYFTVYRGGPMVLLQRKLYFSNDPEGVLHFPGGSNFFQGGGGVLIIIFKETHITCDFLGGSGPQIPPSGSAHAKLQFRSVLSHVILERRPSPVRVSPYSH